MDGIGLGETLMAIVIGLLPTVIFVWLITSFVRTVGRNGDRKQTRSLEQPTIPPADPQGYRDQEALSPLRQQDSVSERAMLGKVNDVRVRQAAAAVTASSWVSRALDEDYVGVWLIPVHLEELLPEASHEEVRDLTQAVLEGLTSVHVHLGDFDEESGQFLPWGPAAISKAMEEYPAVGRPEINQCGWLSRD